MRAPWVIAVLNSQHQEDSIVKRLYIVLLGGPLRKELNYKGSLYARARDSLG